MALSWPARRRRPRAVVRLLPVVLSTVAADGHVWMQGPGGMEQGDDMDMMPVVVNLGPIMDLTSQIAEQLMANEIPPQRVMPVRQPRGPRLVGTGGDIDLPDAFAEMHQDMLRGLMGNFGGQIKPALQSGSSGFQTEVEGSHFRLRASLPGYHMHASGSGDSGQQPLDVKVVGRSLVVRGRQAHGFMTSSFQRSFPLPWEPDAEKVSVSYSAQDGTLLVDVPAKNFGQGKSAQAGASPIPLAEQLTKQDDDQLVDPLQLLGGLGTPQMTISFSSAGRGDGGMMPMPALRGRRVRPPPVVSLFHDLLTGPGGDPAQDPFEQLWRQLDDHSKEPDLDDEGGVKISIKEKRPAPPPLPKPSEEPPRLSPVVVQPKTPKTFWRLPDSDKKDEPCIDIVSPEGVDLVKPEGNRVEVFKKTPESAAGGSMTLVEKLDLPVKVSEKDCAKAKGSAQEHVLRCRVQQDTVKNVRINVIDEL